MPCPAGLHATCSQDQEFRVRALAIQVTRKARWARLGPRRISDTSRSKVTRPGRAGQRLLCIVLIKERNSTNVFTLTAQWLSWWLVCTRYRVRILLLCIFFQTFCTGIYVYMRVYMLLYCYVQVYTITVLVYHSIYYLRLFHTMLLFMVV